MAWPHIFANLASGNQPAAYLDDNFNAISPDGGFLQAGTGAVLRTNQNKERDIVSVKDFGAVGDGVTDDTTAVKNAATYAAANGYGLYFPPGNYLITSTITISTSTNFYIFGAGTVATQIRKSGDTDLFAVTINTGSNPGELIVKDLDVVSLTAMTTGAAFKYTVGGQQPSLFAQNVRIINGGVGGEWKYGFVLAGLYKEATFQNVTGIGINTANFVNYSLTSTGAAGPVRWLECACYNALTFATVSNTLNPGIEGLKFDDCDAVNVANGVIYNNTAGYNPPGLQWLGGHISCTGTNFHCTGNTQISITNSLQYNSSAAGNVILIDGATSDIVIADNPLIGISASNDIDLIKFTASSTIYGLKIQNNHFKTGATKASMNINANNVLNSNINDNTKEGAGPMFNLTGTIDPSFVIKNNWPQDSSDYFVTVAISANAFSVAGVLSNLVSINNPGVATNINTITPRRGAELFHFISNGNITFVHGAGNLIMRGGVNLTPASGDVVTLVYDKNGAVWRAVAP